MANAEHLALLLQGAGRWNRERPPLPDLAMADLTEANLREANLTEANLIRAKLREANLREANLTRTNLREADLTGAYLTGANLTGAHLTGADLSRAHLTGADMTRANLRGAYLAGADLARANLREGDLLRADLTGADLRGATLIRANLAKANLNRANLARASLNRADLNEATLSEANLTETDLREANLRGANIIRADLSRADLSGTYLHGASMSGANLTGAAFESSVIAGVDVRGVIGLESARHDGPSSVGVDTLYASRGQIPEVFLRGCGVPDLLIRYLPDLTVDAESYFSAFISYSHTDSAIADRLHGDLFIVHRISCWKDSHDLRAGEPIAGRIRRAIRADTDKVLLLCSEASLNSEWVDDELNTIFGVERELGRARRQRGDAESRIHLVIPVDLDGYLFSPACDHQWTDRIRDRLAVNLRDWRTPTNYQTGLEKVMKALESTSGTIRPGRRLW